MLPAWRPKNTGNHSLTRQFTDPVSERPLIMDWQSPRNKWWMRIVAVTLTIAFIHQDIVWAQEGTPVWSKQSAGGPFNPDFALDFRFEPVFPT